MHTGRMTEADSRGSLHLVFAVVFTVVSAIMLVAVLVRPTLLGHAEAGQGVVRSVPRAVVPLLGVGAGLAGIAVARRERRRRTR